MVANLSTSADDDTEAPQRQDLVTLSSSSKGHVPHDRVSSARPNSKPIVQGSHRPSVPQTQTPFQVTPPVPGNPTLLPYYPVSVCRFFVRFGNSDTVRVCGKMWLSLYIWELLGYSTESIFRPRSCNLIKRNCMRITIIYRIFTLSFYRLAACLVLVECTCL